MTPEQKKSAIVKMVAFFFAGLLVEFYAAFLMGDNNTRNVIGFVLAFVGIALMVTASRIAKSIKKEVVPQ